MSSAKPVLDRPLFENHYEALGLPFKCDPEQLSSRIKEIANNHPDHRQNDLLKDIFNRALLPAIETLDSPWSEVYLMDCPPPQPLENILLKPNKQERLTDLYKIVGLPSEGISEIELAAWKKEMISKSMPVNVPNPEEASPALIPLTDTQVSALAKAFQAIEVGSLDTLRQALTPEQIQEFRPILHLKALFDGKTTLAQQLMPPAPATTTMFKIVNYLNQINAHRAEAPPQVPQGEKRGAKRSAPSA